MGEAPWTTDCSEDRSPSRADRDAWDRAADRTPHGAPITLQPEDFGP
jgi:hypothetical protein